MFSRKQISFIFIFALSGLSVYGQQFWEKSFDVTTDHDFGIKIVLDPAKSPVVVSHTSCFQNAALCAAFAKLDSNGTIDWQVLEDDNPYSTSISTARILSNQKIWLGLWKRDSISGLRVPFLSEYDQFGTKFWHKKLTFPDSSATIYEILQCSDDSIYVFTMGYIRDSTGLRFSNAYTLFDSSGVVIESKELFNDVEVSVPSQIIKGPKSGFLMLSQDYDIDTFNFLFPVRTVKRYDRNLNLVHEFHYGPEENGGHSIACDRMGNIYCTYRQNRDAPGSGFSSPSIISFDSLGTLRWSYIFDDSPLARHLTPIELTSDSKLISVGWNTQANDNFAIRGWIVCLSTDGDYLWERKYAKSGFPHFGAGFNDIELAADNSIFVTGRLEDTIPKVPSYAATNTWVLRLDPDGCLEPGCSEIDIQVSIKDEIQSSNAGLQMSLSPNPSVREFRIQLQSKNRMTGMINVSIISTTGKIVSKTRIAAADFNNTGHLFEIHHLVPGVYFVKVQSEANSISKKLIVTQ